MKALYILLFIACATVVKGQDVIFFNNAPGMAGYFKGVQGDSLYFASLLDDVKKGYHAKQIKGIRLGDERDVMINGDSKEFVNLPISAQQKKQYELKAQPLNYLQRAGVHLQSASSYSSICKVVALVGVGLGAILITTGEPRGGLSVMGIGGLAAFAFSFVADDHTRKAAVELIEEGNKK